MNNPLSVDPNLTALHKPEPSTDQPEATTDPKTVVTPPLGDTAITPPGQTPTHNAALPDVPGYEVQKEIARGGMGRVLAARDLSLDREVAIKLLLLEDSDSSRDAAARRFVVESKITARLPHPNVPPVHTLGTLPGGSPFLTMKLVRGQTLAALLAARPSPADDVPRFVQVFEQIAQAVGFAHAQGVIHRDLKPANVMVGAFGEVQVMDWGIAKDLRNVLASPGRESGESSTNPDDETQAGQVMGTPQYMSPEQARGEPVDYRTDVFSLGGILCAILTGKPPFTGKNSLDVIKRAAAGDVSDACARLDASGADAELIALARRCLSPNAADRPAEGKAVADAVAAYRAGVENRLRKAEADSAEAKVRESEGRRRRRIQRTAALAVIVVLAIGIAGTTIGLVREATQRGIAEENERSAVKAAEEERLAKVRESEQRLKAEKARDRTREALDAMTSKVAGDSLATQKAITEEQKKFLAEVLNYYQEFAGEKADDELSRKRTAVAANKVGFIEYRLGHWEASATAFRMASDSYASLAIDFPTEPMHRPNLARNLNNLGAQLVKIGKSVEAEAEYRKALAIQEKLAAEFPTAPVYRQELALSYNNLGALFDDLKKRVEAEGEYRLGLGIRKKLAADFPKVPAYRQHLAGSHNNLGNLLANRGKRAEAEVEFRMGLTVQEKLAADFPAVPAYRQDLARSHNGLGNLLANLGKRAEAEVEYRQALELQEKLAADFPAVPEYREGLALSHSNLGDLLANLGKRADGEREYRQALAILETLAADFPTVPVYRQYLAKSHTNLGALLGGVGKRSEAEAETRKALAICAALATDFPTVPGYRHNLAGSHNNLGVLLNELGKRAEAEVEYGKALALQEKLAADFPAEPEYREGLALSHYNFACLYAMASGKGADKKQEFADRAMEMLHKAVKAGYTDAAEMAKDKDLDPLRDRADFKQLLASLQPKPKVTEKPRELAPPPREIKR